MDDQVKEYNRLYHAANRERILARKKENYQKNKDKPKKEKTEDEKAAARKYQREWRRENRKTPEGKAKQKANDKRYQEKNKEKIKSRRKEQYSQNSEKIRASNKKYYETNADKCKAQKREYCKLNRDRVRLSEKAIEHKRRSAKGKLTAADVELCIDEANGHCVYCGREFCRKELQIDHVIPLTRGGYNSPDNVIASCGRCNKRKRNKTPLEFLLNWPRVTSVY